MNPDVLGQVEQKNHKTLMKRDETTRHDSDQDEPAAVKRRGRPRRKLVLVEEFVRGHPTWSTRSISRALLRLHPAEFTDFEQARSLVRYVRGELSASDRRMPYMTMPRPETGQRVANVEQYLRDRLVATEHELKAIRSKLGGMEEFASKIRDVVRPIKPCVWQTRGRSKGRHEIAPVLLLGDWHIGEVIRENETESLNKYNSQVARDGLERIICAFLDWVECNRSVYDMPECAIIGLGDWISGEIRDELRVTAEFPSPVQAVKAGQLLAEAIGTIAGHFKTVSVYEVGGDNHGRMTKRPRAKRKAEDNLGYVVYSIANAMLRKCKNVLLMPTEGMKMLVHVNGIPMLCEHGDNVRAWMGVPWYGINREVGREATRRMNDLRFRYLVTGHWHTPCFLEDRIIVNGSLSGTSEYDHACGRFARPCQVGFMVSARHGVFDFTPFYRS